MSYERCNHCGDELHTIYELDENDEEIESTVCPRCDCEDCLDESMDGDFDSGMTSAGYGTDEDYGGEGSFY